VFPFRDEAQILITEGEIGKRRDARHSFVVVLTVVG
jgi:hypothetical protein